MLAQTAIGIGMPPGVTLAILAAFYAVVGFFMAAAVSMLVSASTSDRGTGPGEGKQRGFALFKTLWKRHLIVAVALAATLLVGHATPVRGVLWLTGPIAWLVAAGVATVYVRSVSDSPDFGEHFPVDRDALLTIHAAHVALDMVVALCFTVTSAE